MLAFLSKLFHHFSSLALAKWQKRTFVGSKKSLNTTLVFQINWNNNHTSVQGFDECTNTLRLSSAASSFFLISFSDVSLFFRGDNSSSPLGSEVEGLRMTSNAWPEARLLSSFTSNSVKHLGHLFVVAITWDGQAMPDMHNMTSRSQHCYNLDQNQYLPFLPDVLKQLTCFSNCYVWDVSTEIVCLLGDN